jgi:hypothetical protein
LCLFPLLMYLYGTFLLPIIFAAFLFCP